MIVWGILWGAFLGWWWPDIYGLGAIPGAILGLFAGLTLRVSVKNLIDAELQKARGTASAMSAVVAKSGDAAAEKQAASVPTATSSTPSEAPPLAAASIAARATIAASPIATATATAATTAPPKPLTPLPPAPPPAPHVPNALESAVNAAIGWLMGGNTVVRAGVVVLFIGLSFLAKYAAENAMFPVELRLALVGVAGIALLFTGFRLRDKKRGFAMTLQGAGVAVLYLAVFASFKLYALVPPGLALAIMVAVCALSTAIALLQESRALAVIGFAGGFLAPVLASTGGGSHVVLFSYYALLNLAILFIAYKRSWRVLNLVGFFFTFFISALWGEERYRPEWFGTTEPFLIVFFLIYVAAPVFYALREKTQLNATRSGVVDATLVFGNPVVAFGLQAALVKHIEFALAFSALALGAFYLVLAFVLLKRRSEQQRLLIECFLALGVGFVTLAVPLALDARWTAAVWAVEGAAVFWVAMRQSRWMPRLFGLALQVIAAFSFVIALDRLPTSHFAIANPAFIGAVMLALPAFMLSWWTRSPLAHSGSAVAKSYASFETALSSPLFCMGFVWWMVAISLELSRRVSGIDALGQDAVPGPLQGSLFLLSFVMSAFVAERVATKFDWSVARYPAYGTAIAVLLGSLAMIDRTRDAYTQINWLLWLASLVIHLLLLKRIDSKMPRTWFAAMHTIGVWAVVIFIANALVYAVNRADLWRTAWAAVVLLIAAILVLVALASWATSSRLGTQWPFASFAKSYLVYAATPIAVVVFLGVLVVSITSNGRADPLPYVPLLNPTDLSLALGIAGLVLWLNRLKRGEAAPSWLRSPALTVALAALAFVAINTVWLRVAHHFANVAWNANDLFNSFLVQTGYAILWTVMAVVLMVLAHRRAQRALWMVGAALLALTVAKLFFVDLSNAGGTERIVAFIVVGVMMLIVGYVAPLPPTKRATHEPVKAV